MTARGAGARAFAVLALVALAACGGRDEHVAAPLAPAVRTVQVKSVGQAPLELRGAVQAGSRLRLGFKLPGVVSTVLVKEGDQVRKGQIIARLDQLDARSQLRTAGASRAKAGRDWLQANRLVKAGALPASARDDARSDLEAADANWVVASDNLKRTELISPVSGRVVQRLVQPGENIGAGVPALIIDDTETLVVKVGVTERDLARLSVGQPASLRAEDGSEAVKGEVSSVAASPSSTDGLYSVEIRPEATKLQLGSLMTVRFDGAAADPVVRIPLNAMVRRQDKDWVFVVERGEQDKVAHLRPLDLGRTEGREITVRSGLKDGESIVTEGAYFLQDGQPIRVVD